MLSPDRGRKVREGRRLDITVTSGALQNPDIQALAHKLNPDLQECKSINFLCFFSLFFGGKIHMK